VRWKKPTASIIIPVQREIARQQTSQNWPRRLRQEPRQRFAIPPRRGAFFFLKNP
jgi:hypothetical protein